MLISAFAVVSAVASGNLRNGAQDVWSHVISALKSVGGLTQPMFAAIVAGDPVKFLNAVCMKYTGEECWPQNRRLVDYTVPISTDGKIPDSMNPKNLLEKFPNNRDNILAPPSGYSSLDEWLQAQDWKVMESDHEGAKLAYVKIENVAGKKGALFVVPGKSEPCEKYDEILLSFFNSGYSTIYCIDHRGQGRSSRLLDNHYKNHVTSRFHFVDDLEKFIDTILVPEQGSKPKFLACHSMGCAITLGYLTRAYDEKKETVFNAVAANAPLVKANTDPFPYPVAIAIGQVMTFFGLSTLYAPTKEKTFEEDYGNDNFETSTTQSLQRWLRQRTRCYNKKDMKVGVDQHIGLCLGGLTAGMATEFFGLYDELEAFKGKITTPFLTQVAGDLSTTDGLVLNPDTVDFHKRAMKNGKLTNYRTSKHQIWWNSDSIMSSSLGEVNDFFARNANKKVPQCKVPTCGSWNWSWRNWGCKDSENCSYQYQFGDYHLGMSCRPKTVCK